MPKLLTLVAKTSPLLREIMPNERDFKDPALQQIIKDMCYSILPEQLKAAGAGDGGAAGMAANQWGIKRRVFIYTPDGSEADKESEIVINPSYTPYLRPTEIEYKLVAAYEGCFSIPLTIGVVNRYEAIIATYYTPAGDKVERLIEGWDARVFQHETDHLDGKLYDGRLDNFAGPECLERNVFKNTDEADAWLSQKRARRNAEGNDNNS